MKKLLLTGLLAIVVSIPAVAATHKADQSWDQLTTQQQKQKVDKAKAAWSRLSPDEQAKVKKHMQAAKKWQQLSPEEQQRAINNAREALQVLPPQVKRQLFREHKGTLHPKGKTAKQKALCKNIWNTLRQLPVDKRSQIIQSSQ